MRGPIACQNSEKERGCAVPGRARTGRREPPELPRLEEPEEPAHLRNHGDDDRDDRSASSSTTAAVAAAAARLVHPCVCAASASRVAPSRATQAPSSSGASSVRTAKSAAKASTHTTTTSATRPTPSTGVAGGPEYALIRSDAGVSGPAKPRGDQTHVRLRRVGGLDLACPRRAPPASLASLGHDCTAKHDEMPSAAARRCSAGSRRAEADWYAGCVGR